MKSICVFCGSNNGFNEIYAEKAEIFGKLLAGNNITLVYGGGNIGLMGIIADASLSYNGEVVGVITQKLKDIEVAHTGLSKMHIVETMSERKLMMEQFSDAFVILPGGYGTLDEMFEMITLNQLSIIKKPIGVLNVNGFFNPLITLIDNSIKEGFIKADHKKLFVIEENEEILLEKLLGFDHVDTTKWLDSFKNS